MSLRHYLTSLLILLISAFATLTLAHPPFNPSPTDPVGSRGWHSAHPAVGSAAPTNPLASNPDKDWTTSPDSVWWMSLPSKFNAVRIAHAVLASSAFLVFFPLGGILVRICSHRVQIVWIHAAIQGFGYAVFATAAGLGIWLAKPVDRLHSYHQILGLLLLCLLGTQPLLQLVNHRLYARYPRISVYLAHTHLWFGRILITVGMINGGLGFQSASNTPPRWSTGPKIAYGVVATVVWIVYVAVVLVWAEFGRGPRERHRSASLSLGAELDSVGHQNHGQDEQLGMECRKNAGAATPAVVVPPVSKDGDAEQRDQQEKKNGADEVGNRRSMKARRVSKARFSVFSEDEQEDADGDGDGVHVGKQSSATTTTTTTTTVF